MSNSVLVKVVGTTFHPLPDGHVIRISKSYMKDNIPMAIAPAILRPDPSNPYDENAVEVLVELDNGDPFVIGFIGKDDPWQRKITQLTLATIQIKDYSQASTHGKVYNPAYQIINIEME